MVILRSNQQKEKTLKLVEVEYEEVKRKRSAKKEKAYILGIVVCRVFDTFQQITIVIF